VHAAIQLVPVLAAEKSKVPFYIAGGLLVAWALFISLAIGMRKPTFPQTLGQQRAVMGVSIVLVLAAVSMAVVTSGTPAKSSAATTTTSTSAAAPEAATTPAETSSSTQPTATTGTPAPASSPAAATKLSLAADPGGQLSYSTKELTAKAGTVTITFTNESPVEHNVTVAEGSKVLGATPTFAGGSKTLTLTLKAGTYTFYCSVPGHRQAGMEGTLKVT
jgi:plastocyanin